MFAVMPAIPAVSSRSRTSINGLAVDESLQPIALGPDLEAIPGLRVVGEWRGRQFPPGADAEFLIDRQPQREPEPLAVLEREPVVAARGAIAEREPRLFLQ